MCSIGNRGIGDGDEGVFDHAADERDRRQVLRRDVFRAGEAKFLAL
jgi:hypothetical protein